MGPTQQCLSFEQGPIRPPSEARSLLIRVTRNCPWNRCAFCRTYRGERFSLRPLAEVQEEVRRIGETIERLGGGAPEAAAEGLLARDTPCGGQAGAIAAWLLAGEGSVFLQDADSLMVKTDELAELISFIRRTLPSVGRITTYGRAKTAARKRPDELKLLREAGLTRIHMGLETGCDPLLAFIRKGATAAEQVAGGQKIREAGISLCQYVMPGLGGGRWSREHAVETAAVLNRINPDHIRLRTLQVVDDTPLADAVRTGEFLPLDDEEILREVRLFFETLDGISSAVVSDHILNLLEELEGQLPGDRERIIGLIDRYFALPGEERMIFRLGRRMGIYRRLDDLADASVARRLGEILAGYRGRDPRELEADLALLRARYL